MNFRMRIGAALAALLLGTVGAVALASPASAWVYGPFQLQHVSGYCLEAPSGPSGFGQQLTLNYCGGPSSHNQHFTLNDTNIAGSWNYVFQVEGSAYCITPGDADLYNSTIVTWTCNTSSSKFIWHLGFPNGEGVPEHRNLSNNYNGLCIDNYSASPGAYVRDLNCITSGWFHLVSVA